MKLIFTVLLQKQNVYSRMLCAIFRQVSIDLQRETQRRQQEEEAWYRQQKLLLDAEDKRRKMIQDEEQKLTDQRKR